MEIRNVQSPNFGALKLHPSANKEKLADVINQMSTADRFTWAKKMGEARKEVAETSYANLLYFETEGDTKIRYVVEYCKTLLEKGSQIAKQWIESAYFDDIDQAVEQTLILEERMSEEEDSIKETLPFLIEE